MFCNGGREDRFFFVYSKRVYKSKSKGGKRDFFGRMRKREEKEKEGERERKVYTGCVIVTFSFYFFFTLWPQRVCHFLRVERARSWPKRVCHFLRVARARSCVLNVPVGVFEDWAGARGGGD